jgi:SAM-dependent methyltransferase
MTESITRIHRNCPICNHSESFDHADNKTALWHLKTCRQCGFVFLQDPPNYDALIHDFAWEKTYQTELKRRTAAEPVLSRISQITHFLRHRVFKRNKLARMVRKHIPSGRVLDVGCGSGGQLTRWFNRDYEPWGIEISAFLADKANALFTQYGGQCIHKDAVGGLMSTPDKFFDGIIMMSYLEHEIDARGVCEASFRSLRPGGRLIIKVPNHASWNRRIRNEKWCGYRFPDHVNYFTPHSLSVLIKEIGFEIIQFNLNDRMPTSDNMWMIAQRPKEI